MVVSATGNTAESRKTMPEPNIAATSVQVWFLVSAGPSRRPSYNPAVSAKSPGARPRIALTYGLPTQHNQLSWRRYRDALEHAGAAVVAVYPGDELPGDIDGVLLSGGSDVDPARYGEPNAASEDVDGQRDELEVALLQRALDEDLPVLGICRGFQLLNVALGGRLVQHVDGHRPADRDGVLQHRGVLVAPGSRLAAAVGEGPLTVNSRHHQAVTPQTLAPALRATAMVDGLVEAFESPEHRWLVGVQWHPERTAEVSPGALGVFDALVDQAAHRPAGVE
jgi:putative glutamine amidotransferase